MISFFSYFFASLKQHLVGMIIIFFLVACTVGAIALKHSPVMFQAEARINIPENSRNMEKQAEKERLEKTSSNVPEQQMLTLQTAVAILQGNVLAERVIQTIGQKKIFSHASLHLEQKIQGEERLSHVLAVFQKRLKVTSIKGTRIVNITFQHENAEMSAQVVSTIIQLFQDKYLSLQSHQASLHNELFGQLLSARQEMHRAKRTVSMFKQRNQVLLVGEPPEKLTERYNTMKTQLSVALENGYKSLDQLHKLEEQFTDALRPDHLANQQVTPEKLNELNEFNEARKDLVQLKLYEQTLRDKYGEGSSGERLIANVGLQIAALEKHLYAQAQVPEVEQQALHNQLHDRIKQIVAAQKSYNNQQVTVERLQRQIRQTENALQRVAEQNEVLKQLEQEVTVAQQQYASIIEQFEQEKTSKKISERIQIIEKPVVPLAPIKPKQKTALLLALFSGLIGSILYLMLNMLRKRALGGIRD
ncbi:MAG: hypothetical protein D3905_08890 [Candidatus Electrothrix sp. AS4_5]|nr:hypothetical protein [Candidatus Electrothrix gigas]